MSVIPTFCNDGSVSVRHTFGIDGSVSVRHTFYIDGSVSVRHTFYIDGSVSVRYTFCIDGISLTYLERKKCYGPDKKILFKNQRLPGACNRSPGSKLLSITTQLHYGGHLGGRA